MPSDHRAWPFHSRPYICCCIPVRAGFAILSILTFLLSAAIAIIVWFEMFHSYQLSTSERAAFISTGIAETLLCLASTFGLVGVVARKQLFVMIYTYFLYIHCILNLVVGIYFLVAVGQSNREQLVGYCSQVFANTSVEPGCSRLVGIPTYVFVVVVAALLLLEFYGALIATRYTCRLSVQRRDNQSRRLGYIHALCKPELLGHSHQISDNVVLLRSQHEGELQDPEDVVLDIRRQSYMSVPTIDHDLPSSSPPSPPLSPPLPLLDTVSGRRFRALPPRPSASPGVTETASCVEEKTARPARLPNSHEFTSHPSRERQRTRSGSEDEQLSLYTSELSASAHAALMDHAAYMEPLFSSAPAQHRSRGLVR